jgi:hypothetical protein
MDKVEILVISAKTLQIERSCIDKWFQLNRPCDRAVALLKNHA